MACLKVKGPLGERLIPEALDGNVRGKQADEVILGVAWDCGPWVIGDSMNMEDMVTREGFMLGNAIKKVTTKLGIKQCMACRGRQARYNHFGLQLQQKVKALIS